MNLDMGNPLQSLQSLLMSLTDLLKVVDDVSLKGKKD